MKVGGEICYFQLGTVFSVMVGLILFIVFFIWVLWSLCWEFSVILSLFLSLSVGCCGLCGGKLVSTGRIVSRFRNFRHCQLGVVVSVVEGQCLWRGTMSHFRHCQLGSVISVVASQCPWEGL